MAQVEGRGSQQSAAYFYRRSLGGRDAALKFVVYAVVPSGQAKLDPVPVIAGFPPGWRPTDTPASVWPSRERRPRSSSARAAAPVPALRAAQQGRGARALPEAARVVHEMNMRGARSFQCALRRKRIDAMHQRA
jgi:hypothetical protein